VVLVNPREVPSDISHSHYTALTIKNALVDAVRDLRDDGERPSVDIESADVPLVAFVKGGGGGTTSTAQTTSISLYRQLHHGSLHKRGYRSNSSIHKASMKESMAAGLLLATNYDFSLRQEDHHLTICDPMAGSGSLILEACMLLGDVAPGIMRIKCGVPNSKDPPVLKWKSEEKNVTNIWNKLLLDAASRAKHGLSMLGTRKVDIVANEVHPGALDLLEDSLYKAGFSHFVKVHQGDCQDFILPPSNSSGNVLVVTNPPWGVRLTEDMHDSWEALRVFLRENCPPGRTTAWILSGNKSATKHLGLRRSQSLSLKTGQQDLRWIQYEILEKRPKQQHEQQNGGDDENVETIVEKNRMMNDNESYCFSRTPKSSKRHLQVNDETIRGEEPLIRPRRYTPRQQKPKSRVSSSSQGRGYERRNRTTTSGNNARRNDGSITEPLSDKERQERKKSWYI
jgi:23S rRNA G2445 N2-methylase RlmL